jgi:aminoglycoside 3-N-acetyltransferase
MYLIFGNSPLLPLFYKLNAKLHITSIYKKLLAKTRLLYNKLFIRSVTKQQIISDLKNLGLKEADVVLVHSSLSRMGYVEGGANTVIDALLETVGSKGTVVVPTLTFSPEDFLSDSPPVFDFRKSPCYTGKIPEIFLQREGAVRSIHPTHSVAAIGPHTQYLVKDNEKSETPCGKNSPFSKLIELDGYILVLGSRFGQITSFHVVEDAVSNFPISVYMKESVKARYVDNDGMEQTMMLKLHNDKAAMRRIDNRKNKEQELFDYCLEHGIIKIANVGKTKSYLIKARDLESVLEELLLQGITIYLPEK